MRFVSRDLNDKPAILTAGGTIELLVRIIRGAKADLINDKLYQDPYTDANGKTKRRVLEKLNEYYFTKCAYCETLCKAEIEHYRPKKRISGKQEVPGYYWLCYEWSNLIPSCHDCNTSGGKGTQFPIQGERALPPTLTDIGELPNTGFLASELITELPFLLHPELDDPTQYLYFDIDPNLKGIQIRGLDGQNNRGEHTISICNLNRPDLKLKRLRILENYISLINSAFEMLRKGIIKDNQFVESLFIHFDQFFENTTDIELEHTFLVKYVISNYDKFEIIILPLLLEKQRAIVSTAFKMYLNQRNIV